MSTKDYVKLPKELTLVQNLQIYSTKPYHFRADEDIYDFTEMQHSFASKAERKT